MILAHRRQRPARLGAAAHARAARAARRRRRRRDAARGHGRDPPRGARGAAHAHRQRRRLHRGRPRRGRAGAGDGGQRRRAGGPRGRGEAARRRRSCTTRPTTSSTGRSRRRTPRTTAARPLGVYGETKLAGEAGVRGVGAPHLILRTSWVYGARGANFLRTILRAAAAGKPLRVVDDQHGAPTWCRMLAEATALVLAQTGAALRPDALEDYGGTYHLTAAGETTWHGFASAILELAPQAVRDACPAIAPVPTAAYPTKARRPANSRLDNARFRETFGFSLPDWRDSLALVMAEIPATEFAYPTGGSTHEARPDHRHHRPGRLVPRRAAARQGVRGPRHQAPLQLVQHPPHRPPLPRRARAPGAPAHALRRPGGRQPPDEPHLAAAPGRGLPPRGAEPRQGQLRRAGVHRGRHRARHDPPARGDPGLGGQGALLPGLLLGDVRRRAAAAERADALPPAQPVRRGQGLRLLDHRELPRELRALRLQRHPLQPRVAAPRRDLRHAQDHPRARRDPRRAPAHAAPRATSTRSATGASRRTTSSASGGSCSRSAPTTS